MRTIVPFDATRPKTRLDDVLTETERHAFARVMLRDVLAALRAAGLDPEVLATEPVDVDAPVTVDERALTPAVNAVLAESAPPVAVVMADLALATPAALEGLFAATGDLVVAPGRGGGTNAFLTRTPDFRVDYHGASYLDHLAAARTAGASVRPLDSYRLATDIDERADLVEVLLHGEGAAPGWLREAGFELVVDDGRVGTARSPE